MKYELGFIGAGNMAQAIVRAAVDRKIVLPNKIMVADPSEKCRSICEKLGVCVTDDNQQVIAQSKQILLAIKPQMLEVLASALQSINVQNQIIVSIMAGVGSAKIEAAIGQNARVVRVMPNTPLMVGQGMAGIALGGHAKPDDASLALQLFRGAGKAIVVSESDLDAITAVSGSGPAYLFYLAEAMEQAACALGLSDHARVLVTQTLLGSAQLLSESDDAPQALRQKVTSPGGTTEAAINSMENQGIQDAIVRAIEAANQRSKELGG